MSQKPEQKILGFSSRFPIALHAMQVDISQVVVDQMQKKHADMPNLEYVCADCREMPCFRDCSFASAIDKGELCIGFERLWR